RNLSNTNNVMGKSLEKLSSGYRINRAADDAAGLVISQGLRAQVSGLRQATRNAQDGVSVVQTAEGALNEVHSMLNRMRDLAVQAANGSNDGDARAAAQAEIDELAEEVDRISETTRFGQISLLNGDAEGTAAEPAELTFTASDPSDMDFSAAGGELEFDVVVDGTTESVSITDDFSNDLEGLANEIESQVSGLDVSVDGSDLVFQTDSTGEDATLAIENTNGGAAGSGIGDETEVTGTDATGGIDFQVGANSGDTINFSIGSVAAGDLGVDAIDVESDAESAIGDIDAAITSVSDVRGDLGAVQNRFESTINNLQVTTENLSASESRIRDTDMAEEMVSFTRHQILQQAGTAMLGQANAMPQSVLGLLG
ncbi:MAG: flagellin, partial [Acidimicrobiales bacterium]